MLYNLHHLVHFIIISLNIYSTVKGNWLVYAPPPPPTFCETLSIENEMFEMVNNNMCYFLLTKI